MDEDVRTCHPEMIQLQMWWSVLGGERLFGWEIHVSEY